MFSQISAMLPNQKSVQKPVFNFSGQFLNKPGFYYAQNRADIIQFSGLKSKKKPRKNKAFTLPSVKKQSHVVVPKKTADAHNLYELADPYKVHRLKVSSGHELHVSEFGNPKGVPILNLHGGPGGGGSDRISRVFDPKFYRLITFDQRGAGRSAPHLSLEDNNTQALIGDIETIREFLGIEQWAVTGYSWGSTLSTAYAQIHPDKVTGLVLGGMYLGNQDAIDWLYKGGAKPIFPDLWEKTLSVLPEHDRVPDKILKGFLKKMKSADKAERNAAMTAWNNWESSIVAAKENPALFEKPVEDILDARAQAIALIECFYAYKNYFLKPDQLLNEADKIKDIPTWIVHGRNDWVCPFKNAWDLHNKLPNSQLVEVEQSGHGDVASIKMFSLATESLKKQLEKAPKNLQKTAGDKLDKTA